MAKERATEDELTPSFTYGFVVDRSSELLENEIEELKDVSWVCNGDERRMRIETGSLADSEKKIGDLCESIVVTR